MNRPRIVAVVSAILGSTAGCLVLSRWRLAGTITGAVVVPVIYALVSHCSVESLDRLGRWARRLVHRGKADGALPETQTTPQAEAASIETASTETASIETAPKAETASIETASIETASIETASIETAPKVETAQEVEAGPTPTARVGRARLQWSLAAFAFLAFVTSIYSLVGAEPAQQTIVRERVIANTIVEKTVTVTSPTLLAPVAVADTAATSSTTLSADGGVAQDTGGGGVTTSSTTTTLSPGPAD